MKAWINRHPLSSFFVVAYGISWSVAVPLALQAQGVLPTHLPWVLHYVTAFGPAGAALVITRWLERPQPRRRQQSGTRSLAWMAVGFGSPLLLYVVALVAARSVGQPAPTWRSLGHINFLPDLGVMAWALWFFTSGIGEEFGWRGFALPELQRTRSAMQSTILLAIGWAGWHLPAFFYVPSYTAIGLRVLPGFFLGVLAGAIVLTWLYNSSSGSVLAAVLWHASFNFVTASPNAGGFVAAVTSTLVMVWAIAVVWRYDWATLATRSAARSVGASREEQSRPLPGDERILNAIDSERVETQRHLFPFTDPDPADRSVFNQLFYRNRRPTWIGHWVSQFFCWWARVGLPPRSWVALEVRDRASGRTRSDAVVVPTVAGERYIVSMFGTISDWVQNVDAAHGDAVISHGRPQRVRLVLVPPEARAPILRHYVQVASSGRKHFPLAVGAPLADFTAIAAQYPVYRVDTRY